VKTPQQIITSQNGIPNLGGARATVQPGSTALFQRNGATSLNPATSTGPKKQSNAYLNQLSIQQTNSQRQEQILSPLKQQQQRQFQQQQRINSVNYSNAGQNLLSQQKEKQPTTQKREQQSVPRGNKLKTID